MIPARSSALANWHVTEEMKNRKFRVCLRLPEADFGMRYIGSLERDTAEFSAGLIIRKLTAADEGFPNMPNQLGRLDF